MGKAKKSRDLRTLRAAGLTLASADRLAGHTGGSSLAMGALGGAALFLLAGLGVYSMNAPRAPAIADVANEGGAVTIAPPAPASFAVAASIPDPVQAAPQSMPETTVELPWVVALRNGAAPEPAAASDPVAVADCVTTLMADISGVILQFAPGSAEIATDAQPRLIDLGRQINACPGAQIQVAGHSDSSGSDLTNLQLSWARAENTVDTMAALGIDVSQMEAVGFGSRAPLEQGDTSDSPLNRRVELRVLRAGPQP